MIHNFHRRRFHPNNIDNSGAQGLNPQDGHILTDIWSRVIAYAGIAQIGIMQTIFLQFGLMWPTIWQKWHLIWVLTGVVEDCILGAERLVALPRVNAFPLEGFVFPFLPLNLSFPFPFPLSIRKENDFPLPLPLPLIFIFYFGFAFSINLSTLIWLG